MREKSVSIHLRISESDNKALDEMCRWGNWNKSQSLRFCLSFTHILLSILPAALIDAIMDDMSTKEDFQYANNND